MPDVSKELILLLQYLVPGFLVAWICFGMTSHQKPSQFERVVQALIYSLFVQFTVTVERSIALQVGTWLNFGPWSKDGELFASLLTAVALGAIFSYIINSDVIHGLLRKFNLSTRSSHPSEWCTAFDTKKSWIVVHRKDDRRIYGWPHIWPSDPAKGHLFLTHASWLRSETVAEANSIEEPLGPQQEIQILIDVADVKWIEFITNPEETSGNQTPISTDPDSSNIPLDRAA